MIVQAEASFSIFDLFKFDGNFPPFDELFLEECLQSRFEEILANYSNGHEFVIRRPRTADRRRWTIIRNARKPIGSVYPKTRPSTRADARSRLSAELPTEVYQALETMDKETFVLEHD